MMRKSTISIALLSVAAMLGVAQASGPHFRRWSAGGMGSQLTGTMVSFVTVHVDETHRRMQATGDISNNDIFGPSISSLCSRGMAYIYNSTFCIPFRDDSCFSNPMDFRSGQEQGGSCGPSQRGRVWKKTTFVGGEEKDDYICADSNRQVHSFATVSESDVEVISMRWFKSSASTEEGFWNPPSYCGGRNAARLLEAHRAPAKGLGLAAKLEHYHALLAEFAE